LLKRVLEREGYCVQDVSDGTEAVRKLGVGDYDVIILDLMMPNLDGFALMKTITEADPSRLRKVIVTSAASSTVIQERMQGAPFDILPKPFDIVDLVARVRACILAQAG
jgi:DNA-binding response OmpR family regulator